MKVWCDSLTFNAQGKTAGTYDFETSDTITIKKGGNHILGIIASTCITKGTAGISACAILRVASDDLGIYNQDFVVGGVSADVKATNNVEEPVKYSWIPFYSTKEDAGGAKITFSVSTTSAQTEGYDGAVGVVFSDSPPDADFRMELLAQQHGPLRGGKTALSAAGISAASHTAFSNTIAVPSHARELMALLSLIQNNAPTADDPLVGTTKFIAPAIEDFQPQEWPTCIAWNGILGTPADSSPTLLLNYFPTRFPLPRENFAIELSQKCSVAQANAADGITGAGWR